ncbi:FxsA family protein [Paracoccus salsus]|uniref:FxsA family protein n=1 Tax=Paracoccus salsus TaxID=2911061 RepID=UPI001F241A89|nr:FxsA family protein [Paracoccus salsus]MCF3974386.1 FxsA family protein [Paracoccus salsus]
MWLFWVFVAVPIIEIALFIQIGGFIGLWPTLAIVVLTALAGSVLVRSQGAHAWNEVQESFNQMRDPTRPLAHGVMIVAAGILLLTPGFFTDAVGLLLLIPAVRDAVMRYVAQRIEIRRIEMRSTRRYEPHRPPYGDGIIDGDYVVEDDEVPRRPQTPPDLPVEPVDDQPDRRGNSGWTRH